MSSIRLALKLGTIMMVEVWALPALPPAPKFLLPDNAIPTKYTVDLTIDPNRDWFEGWVRIEVELRAAQKVLWLNSKDLAFQQATIQFGGHERPIRAEAVAGEFAGIELAEPIGPGPALLSLRYRGPLNEKPVAGPYRVRFEDNWYVFTSFTPIDARRAFPCFDEPQFKTPWEITLHVKREHNAFANAPAASESVEDGGMKAVHFAATEPLPPEVVAFAVGPLDIFAGTQVGLRNVPVRVITPKGHAVEGAYAARATAEVLPRLEAYTGIPYPYGKLDHIALPEGAFGATENPGLITYRMNGLLIPSGKETPQRERAVRAIQAHELAHQWFGDLVTQALWEDVWLSEGFATWLSQKVMDEEQTPARRHLSAIAARERIMGLDAGPKAHPVRLAMHDREEMKTVYNPFVYQKGAAVLLMLEHWLGEERLRTGLQAYLRQHRFGTATTRDLAAALQDATGRDVAPVLHSFLDRAGIPALRAEVHCEHGMPARIMIEQVDTRTTWVLPVCWKSDAISAICAAFDKPSVPVDLGAGAACPAFVDLNAGGTGYYRSEYTLEQATALVNHRSDLSPAERLTVAYDLRWMEKAGRIGPGAVKPLLEKLDAAP